MKLARHLEIGIVALGRGLLGPARLADAMAELVTGAHGIDFWLRIFTREQLEAVLAETEERRSASDKPSLAPTALMGSDGPIGKAPSLPDRSTPPTVPRGTDRYNAVGVRGTGGMGAVVECLDQELGRRVALKHLRAEFVGDAAAENMLAREARVTGSLEHPNIVPVYDVGSTPAGGPFYVMRLVEQPSLAEVLTKLAAADPEVSAKYSQGRLLRHFIQICETVDYAHSRGVVHCDLKPANVLLGEFGEVLVLDWGLAYHVTEGTAYRGGTPGYMAPEQLDRNAKLDPRADVYALGVILYEMLALESFEHAPRRRRLAPALDDICDRALAKPRSQRFQSAREMAAAVAAFVEGTKEHEVHLRRADEFAAEGRRLAESYFEFIETGPERVAELAALRAQVPPWEPAEHKRVLWDAEDRLAVTDALGVRTLQAAAAAYEQALDEVPGHAEARRGLARLYRAQLERAEHRRDELDRVYFEELVKQYDDGTVVGAMRADGELAVQSRPAGAVTVATLEEQDRRLVAARPQEVGVTPLAVPLLPGHYQGTLVAGERTVRFPLLVRSGRRTEVVVDLEAGGGPDGDEVLVPGGPARLGGDGDGDSAAESVEVAPFYIARCPVTFGAYLDFLDTMFARDPEAALQLTPRTRDGALYWRRTPGGFEPGRVATWGSDDAELRALPVFGVDALAAEAYARWRSEVTGRAYRLLTEREWEKAGRGTDGRLYPWGDHFDASFCRMRQSRPGLPRPEAPGAFAIDESPYGVRDLAGGVADWVVPSGPAPVVEEGAGDRLMVSRGGAWSDWAPDCRLSARRPYLAVERSSRVGFRLARSAR
jgi:serine/threonine-protein kinase